MIDRLTAGAQAVGMLEALLDMKLMPTFHVERAREIVAAWNGPDAPNLDNVSDGSPWYADADKAEA